jgi:anti-sigma factor RsiW
MQDLEKLLRETRPEFTPREEHRRGLEQRLQRRRSEPLPVPATSLLLPLAAAILFLAVLQTPGTTTNPMIDHEAEWKGPATGVEPMWWLAPRAAPPLPKGPIAIDRRLQFD